MGVNAWVLPALSFLHHTFFFFSGMFDDKEFQSWSQDENRFLRQSVTLVGIGVWGKIKPSLNDTHWVYFPEEKFVFYRLTVLSNFSPEMVLSLFGFLN